jgi:hypothetical protein
LTSLPLDKKNLTAFCAFTIADWEPQGMTACSQRWLQVLGTPLIPFDQKKRKRLEAEVSKSIGKIIELHRKRKLSKARANKSNTGYDEEPEPRHISI